MFIRIGLIVAAVLGLALSLYLFDQSQSAARTVQVLAIDGSIASSYTSYDSGQSLDQKETGVLAAISLVGSLVIAALAIKAPWK